MNEPREVVEPLWSDERVNSLVDWHAYVGMSQRQMADRAFQGGAASVVETAAVKVIISNIRNEYEKQLAAVRAEIKQQDSDWFAMLKAIAAIANNEWSIADDDALWEQFDPWQALREIGEAQAAAPQWELVPDGVYDALCVDCNGSDIGIYIGDDPDAERTVSDYEWLSDTQDGGLPGDIRLFRKRQPAQGGGRLAMPTRIR